MEEKDIKNEELAAMQEEAEGEEVDVVVLTDEDGNESYFMEEMVIPYNGKSYAILVALDDCCEDEECDCHDHDHEDEDSCIIARIDFDENGEAVYVGPTDEEFEAVSAIYENMDLDEE